MYFYLTTWSISNIVVTTFGFTISIFGCVGDKFLKISYVNHKCTFVEQLMPIRQMNDMLPAGGTPNPHTTL